MKKQIIFFIVVLSIRLPAWSAEFKFEILDEKAQNCRVLLARSSVHKQVLEMGKSNPNSLLSRNEFLFAPNFEVVAKIPPMVSEADMLNEKSMYSATPEFAIKNGGPIVRQILAQIPHWYYDKAKELGLHPNIDVRVHNLSLENIPAGYDVYPAIPGWHADGEFRETYFAQPDLNKVPVSFHIITTVSTHESGVSNTQFILNPLKMTVDQILPDSALWQKVHNFVEGMSHKNLTDMQDGDIVMFDARSLHRATPAKRTGWRLFFRMSMWHKPNLGDGGSVSKQEQVYLLPRTPEKNSPLKPVYSGVNPSQIIGSFPATEQIAVLAEEQSLVGASLEHIKKLGGPISKRLVEKIPESFIQNANRNGLAPVVDVLVYRLYPGYRPYFPDYEGRSKAVGWHTPTESTDRQEIWMSVSSHEQGVNQTEFGCGILADGQLFLTSSQMPRRERQATNRGWRMMMRVRLVPSTQVIHQPNIITQQYVDPKSEDTGW
jgi:hypothetical protein